MKTIKMEYNNQAEFKQDEDLRLKGLAFDRLNAYFSTLIRNNGANGILATINHRQSKSSEDLVYKLAEHFRRHLNAVYKDEIENG